MPSRFCRPGSVYISCLALLENARVIDDVWGHVVFDAVISTSVAVDDSARFVGSLRYEAKGPDEDFAAGLYEIHAKIVTFVPNTHERSPGRDDQDFTFMGEHLGDENKERLCLDDHPACLFASGRVTGLDREINTFTISVLQIVNQSSGVGHITVCGVLGINALTNNRANQLPPINSVVSLTGDIMDFSDEVAVVAVDDVTFIPIPVTCAGGDRFVLCLLRSRPNSMRSIK
ncbi:hypothetical protein EDB84DRAFT_1436383 [Lactarius hengduanensis]|nr:hypothetical protein EDB84DRAFT_1436383 [Lactarius hengduanensis]